MGSEVEVTWVRAIQLWWSMLWRTYLFVTLAAIVAGLIIAMIPWRTAWMTGSAPFILSIPIGIWVVRWVIRDVKFTDFRIVLVAVDRTPSNDEE